MAQPNSTANAGATLNIQAVVNGTPTYELSDSHQHDLDVMLSCCDAEEATYWSQGAGSRISAAPFYFHRVAILSAKSGDYVAELAICLRWQSIINDYKSQPMVKSKRAAPVQKGPRSIAILARIPIAKQRIAKASRPKK